MRTVDKRDLSLPIDSVRFTVLPEEDGQRQDAFLLARIHWRSRSDLQRRIAAGDVLVDGQRLRKAAKLRAGQVVVVLVKEGPATEPVRPGSIPVRVLFEDEYLIALDKAAGTVVHPVGRHVNDTLINVLHLRAKEAQGALGGAPMIVHRLDRETSGVIVLAKDDLARKLLGADFEARRVRKTYRAIVCGRPEPPEGLIDLPIGPDDESEIRLKMRSRPDGRPAETAYRTEAVLGRYSLLRLLPRTGRQHQIRVHCAAIGVPIVNDPLYGRPWADPEDDLDDPPRPPIRRLGLHAARLEIRHPITLEDLDLRAEDPPDFGWITEGAAS